MTESPHDDSNVIVPEEEDWNNNASITSHMRQLTESPHDDSNGIVLKNGGSCGRVNQENMPVKCIP